MASERSAASCHASVMDKITETELPPCPWCSSKLTLRDRTAVCPLHGDLEETPEELFEMYQDYLSRPDV